MRERKPSGDAAAQRLRVVLAGSEGDRPVPAAAEPPGGSSTPSSTGGYAGLAEAGEPLQWSDIISGWPDDVDLEAAPSAVFPAPGPGDAAAGGTGGFRPGSPWAAPPAPRPLPSVPAVTGLESTHLADVVPGAAAPAPPRRPLPAPEWVRSSISDFSPAPDQGVESYTFDPASGRFASTSAAPATAPAEPEESPGLTGAGAFGGSEGRRFGPASFDPGRRGVRALVAVAAVVIVIAAALAWRSRPRVDPVAPLPLNPAESGSEAQPRSPVSASAAEVVVAVGGKVRRPGLVRLASGARVADALSAAGGAEPGVDVAVLNLARKVVDGELIMVGVTPPPGQPVPTGPVAPAPGGPTAGGPVNLNTATLADLDGLPGVGPVLAQRILDARDAQGGFKAVSDLRKVDGIGDARYEQLKDLVTI